MRYELLGPLRLVKENEASSITAGKIEKLLTALLVRADQVVKTEQLIAEIWPDYVPRRVNAGLQVYVSKLRKYLDHSGSSIVTYPSGYQLRIGSDKLDVQDFQEHVRRGREKASVGQYGDAAESFATALSLIRGPVGHASGNGPIVQGFAAWSEEAHLECVEMIFDARLALGQHREVIGELYSLTNDHPLCESFYRQLMLALYRSDRQAGALEAFRTARRVLCEELGVEPGRTLQSLHRAILRVDRRLEDVAATAW